LRDNLLKAIKYHFHKFSINLNIYIHHFRISYSFSYFETLFQKDIIRVTNKKNIKNENFLFYLNLNVKIIKIKFFKIK
jgi:hypothetical protein